jgi:hypothetical protein
MRLYASGSSALDGEMFVIEPGQTARIDKRSGRRTIIGQILLPPEGISIEEPLAQLHLRRLSPPEVANFKRHDGFSQVSFKIDFEGKFRIHDVLPDFFKLSAIFFRTLPQGQNSKPDIAGLVVKDFELPLGDGEFDLGSLPLAPSTDIRFG